MEGANERVCVTGAGGFVASWLVKLLLSKGYTVHGTVRDPGDKKNDHLMKLKEGYEKLQLFQADLMNYSSLCAAITGCNGVFHVATPVPPGSDAVLEAELVEPAIVGTLNVLKACSEAKVKRVVVVSSSAAVEMNPNWPKDQVMDETCWSNKEYCKQTKNWYFFSKTVAENEALEYSKRTGLDVVTVCPSIVIGPMLQSTVNGSSLVLIKILKGAGGYVASWLVKLLLSKGYIVHGTVRDPGDQKNAHLTKLEGASESLQLFKADLLNYSSLSAAITGCNGVFHVASPVPSVSITNPEVEMVEPAVMGTLNVLKACSEAKVKRVVVVSSLAAYRMNPNQLKDQIIDEACWSDKEYCKATGNWYCFSKTAAEIEALEYAKKTGLDVVTVSPCLSLGPMLQSSLNASSLVLVKLLRDGTDTIENKVRIIVDVRDVAEALLLTYQKPEAEGRYLCVSHAIRMQDLVNKLRSMHPYYNYPKNFTEVEEEGNLSSTKLQSLGWKFRPLEETLVDSVKSYHEAGVIHKE